MKKFHKKFHKKKFYEKKSGKKFRIKFRIKKKEKKSSFFYFFEIDHKAYKMPVSVIKKKRVRKPMNRSVLPPLASMKTGSRQVNPIAWVRDGSNIRVMRKQLFTFATDMPENVVVDCKYARSIFRWCQVNDFVPNEHIMHSTVGNAAFRIWSNEHSIDNDDWPLSMRSLYKHVQQNVIVTLSLYIIYKTGHHAFLPVPIASASQDGTTFQHKTRGIQPIHCTVSFINEEIDEEELAELRDDSDEDAPLEEEKYNDEDDYFEEDCVEEGEESAEEEGSAEVEEEGSEEEFRVAADVAYVDETTQEYVPEDE